MPIFEVRAKSLLQVPPTSFQAAGLTERAHIQRMLCEKIEYLEEGLLVLAQEFSGWLDSTRRVDILCIDKQARLVVVELKRDDNGKHMELQALRYAAMVSTMTFDHAALTLARTRCASVPDLVSANTDLRTFLGGDEFEEDSFGQETRIILAAADFGKELTTTVLWLRERKIDIKCVRLKPYRLDTGQLLLDVHSLIPLPEAEEFQTRLGEKRRAEQKEKAERHDLRLAFLHALLVQADGRSAPHAGKTPSEMGVLQGSIGKAGLSVNYVTGQTESRVELLIQTENAKQQFASLEARKDEIETAFGRPLHWQQKESSRQCRIYDVVVGGYRSPEADWPVIHDNMIEAMRCLDDAVRPCVAQLG